MKKNKLTTYVLIAAVAIVWGTIIYRVIDATKNDDDESAVPNATTVNKDPYNDYAVPKDTTRLLLNYKDPFGLKIRKDTSPVVVQKIHRSQAVIKPQMNWGFIKYSGYVRNPGSKKIIALLSINGRNVTLAEGESAENVKLIKNLRDSIKISFDGKTKFISMNPRTL